MSSFDDIPLDRLPQVTVLLANYNNADFLKDAIESVLKQTYVKVKLVVIDDCSTDNSWEIIDEYKDKVLGIRMENNVGPSEARNVGIESTLEDTDIYAVLDADDIMLDNKIKRCVMCMMQSPLIGVVYADYDILNMDTGNVIREYKEPFSHKRLLEECIVHSGSLISKQALLAVKDEFGFYDGNMRTCEDYDLWVRIAEKFAICHIAEALTLVRVHSKNSTSVVDDSVWQNNWARIRQKLQIRHVNK